MALYVMLSSLSESGRKVLRQRPGWIRKVNLELEASGAKVGPNTPCWVRTLRDHPRGSRTTKRVVISIEMGARGSVSMMTMPAIPLDTFIGRLQQRDKPGRRAGAPRIVEIFALHPEKCTGCLRCELACSYMQTGTFQPSKSVIRVSPLEGYTSYAPYTCTQCAEGWCMTACPVGAIQINAVGAKDVIDDKCVGCKLCTIACPYGTMFYHLDSAKAYKCKPGANPLLRAVHHDARRQGRPEAALQQLEEEAEGRGGKSGERLQQLEDELRSSINQQTDELRAELARTKETLEAQRTSRTEEIVTAAQAVEARLAELKGPAEDSIAFEPTGEVVVAAGDTGGQGRRRPRLRKIVGAETERVNAELQQREKDEERAVDQKVEDLKAGVDETLDTSARSCRARPRASRTSCARCATRSRASSRCRRSARPSTGSSTSGTTSPARPACSTRAWAPRRSGRSSAGWTSRSWRGPSTWRSGRAPASAARRRSSGSGSSRRSAAPAPGRTG